MNQWRRDLRAWWHLSIVGMRRLLRQGLILRSMLWPPLLAGGTLLATLVVAALISVTASVAVNPEVDYALRQQLASEGWALVETDDPKSVVQAGDAWAGTNGHTLWAGAATDEVRKVEAAIRRHRGSSWVPIPRENLPGTGEAAIQGERFVQMLMLLFALYGVVFGVAIIARDRDDGTLEAELSLPVARWVPGASRWTASTVILAIFLAYCVALFDALVGVPDAPALVRHGIAASGGAVSLGVAVVGRAGIRRGFSGPFAIGLTIATALLAMGLGLPSVGQWLPLSSILAGGDGWVPLVLALLSGVGASALFAWRSGSE